MRMIAPRTGAPEISVAENQPEYLTLTAALYSTPEGARALLTRWRPTPEEREQIFLGDVDIYLLQIIGEGKMQPVSLQVGPEGYEVEAGDG